MTCHIMNFSCPFLLITHHIKALDILNFETGENMKHPAASAFTYFAISFTLWTSFNNSKFENSQVKTHATYREGDVS